MTSNLVNTYSSETEYLHQILNCMFQGFLEFLWRSSQKDECKDMLMDNSETALCLQAKDFTSVEKITYSHTAQLLFHLVQFLLLTGCREKSCGIATFHSINLDWGLEEINLKKIVRQRALDRPNKKVHNISKYVISLYTHPRSVFVLPDTQNLHSFRTNTMIRH